MNSIASNSPIVREIVFRIISSGEIENTGEKHRIDNSLIPSVSKKTHSLVRKDFQESVLKKAVPLRAEQVVSKGPQPAVPQEQKIILEGYGRLNSLIKDPSISSIEYSESLPIKVMRRGIQQNTDIFLSDEEVKSILTYISNRTRIPVANEVFRVAIDNLLFNAVISSEVGTRFLIKKNFQISPDYGEAFK